MALWSYNDGNSLLIYGLVGGVIYLFIGLLPLLLLLHRRHTIKQSVQQKQPNGNSSFKRNSVYKALDLEATDAKIELPKVEDIMREIKRQSYLPTDNGSSFDNPSSNMDNIFDKIHLDISRRTSTGTNQFGGGQMDNLLPLNELDKVEEEEAKDFQINLDNMVEDREPRSGVVNLGDVPSVSINNLIEAYVLEEQDEKKDIVVDEIAPRMLIMNQKLSITRNSLSSNDNQLEIGGRLTPNRASRISNDGSVGRESVSKRVSNPMKPKGMLSNFMKSTMQSFYGSVSGLAEKEKPTTPKPITRQDTTSLIESLSTFNDLVGFSDSPAKVSTPKRKSDLSKSGSLSLLTGKFGSTGNLLASPSKSGNIC